MATYFIDKNDVHGDILIITGELRHHLADVLRLRVGEAAIFADNCGAMYHGVIEDLSKTELRVRVTGVTGPETEPLIDVWLLQSLPKGDKLDTIVRQCTELGVSHIVLLQTDHCDLRLSPEKAQNRAARAQKIAAAAAEQCGRARIPEIVAPCSLTAALEAFPDDVQTLFFYEGACEKTFRQALRDCPATAYALIIGPEGGFSERETDYLRRRAGFAVTMGRRILRTETAGAAALSALLYEKGEGR